MAETITQIPRLLVVSRESSVLRPLSSLADSRGWQIETVATGWDAIERVQSGLNPNVVLLDLPLRDGDSLHVLRWLRRLRPELPVIVTCSQSDSAQKSEALRLGAQDFLIRPFQKGDLEAVIQRLLILPMNGELEIASEDIEQVGPESYFVSACPSTKKVRSQAELLAETDVPVLILGEPGTGKDTVARLIHKLSLRSGSKFIKVNCSDMPADLLEAALFGDGLSRALLPILERNERGTVFIDEISDMPVHLQNRLIMAMDGSASSHSHIKQRCCARLIAATSANIDRALAERRLRQDLYYRFSAFTVHISPLRQRRLEIPILLQHFMHKLSKHYGLPSRRFPSSVLTACQDYSWPGNLKEVEGFVKRYLIVGDAEPVVRDVEPPVVERIVGAGETCSNGTADMQAASASQAPVGSRSLKSRVQDVRGEAERNMIATALRTTGWNRKAAARLLQVSYRTLLYKIEQYHMKASDSFTSRIPDTSSVQNGNRHGH